MGKRGVPIGETHLKILELYQKGYSPVDIGIMVNRPYRYVCTILRKNGFSPQQDKRKKKELEHQQQSSSARRDRRSSSNRASDRAVALAREGFNSKKIALILSYSQAYINKLLRRRKTTGQ